MDVMKTDSFKKAFWDWFDSISPQERKRFNEYKDDFAALYFYNKVWSRKINASVSALATNQE